MALAPDHDFFTSQFMKPRPGPKPTPMPASEGVPSRRRVGPQVGRRAATDVDLRLLPRGPALAGVAATFLQAVRGGRGNLVMLSSAKPAEGKTTTAINIAHGLAVEAGLRPLLVDLNPDHPDLARLLGADTTPGLTEVLSGGAKLADALCYSDTLGFHFLPFGGAVDGRLKTFAQHAGDRLVGALTRLGELFDYVILDGPAVFAPSDPAVIASRLQNVLLVVQCEQTRWEVFTAAESRLAEAGVKPLGVMLNKRRYHVPRRFYGG